MANLYVARQSGTVMIDGRRHPIRRGVTIAEEGSDMLAKHGKLFEPMRVHYPAPAVKRARKNPVEQATAAPGELRAVTPAAEQPDAQDSNGGYACDQCEMTSKSQAGLAAHKRRTHPVAGTGEE